MRMETKRDPVILIAFVLIAITMFGYILYMVLNAPDFEQETKCYDRKGNEIIDQVCIDKPATEGEKITMILVGLMLSVVIIVFGDLLSEDIIFVYD